MASQSFEDSVWSVGRQQSGKGAEFLDNLFLLAVVEKHSVKGDTAWLVAYVPGVLGGRDGYFRLRESDIIKIKVHLDPTDCAQLLHVQTSTVRTSPQRYTSSGEAA